MDQKKDNAFVIQIYEVQEPGEAEQLIDLGVNHIGSVLVSAVDWKVATIKETVALSMKSGAKSSLIPLFQDIELISQALDFYQPNIVHFCDTLGEPGEQSVKDGLPRWQRLVDLQQRVKERFPGIEIMRSIPIPPVGYGNFSSIQKMIDVFEPVSDFFLTDTLIVNEQKGAPSVQPVDGFVGITGVPCDWNLARQLIGVTSVPVILAGGLSPQNVFDGIVHTGPAGVDSCTQTNLRDRNGEPIRFKKDFDKVRRFIDESRRARGYHKDGCI